MFRQGKWSSSPRQNTILPFKQRIQNYRKPKIPNPEYQNEKNQNQACNQFDMKAELKAKIIKAILTSNDTIQKQMAYRKSIVSPQNTKTIVRNFRVISLKENKNKNISEIKSDECSYESDTYIKSERTRNNTQNYNDVSKICLSGLNFNYARCSSQMINRKHIRSRSFTNCTPTHKSKLKNSNKYFPKEQNNKLQPWVSEISCEIQDFQCL